MAIPKILRPLFGPRRRTNEIPDKYDKMYSNVQILTGQSQTFNVEDDMKIKFNLFTVVVDNILVVPRSIGDYTIFRNSDTEGIPIKSQEKFESSEFEHQTIKIQNDAASTLTISLICEGL